MKLLQKTWARATQAVVLGVVLISGAAPQARAQYDANRHRDFYDGSRRGGAGDYSGRDHRYDDRYRRDNYQGHGIGTGRGALIGGAGGAALGAIFGGGLKGSLIGGAAGAGIGAVAGHAHQQSQKRQYYDRRDGYYRR